MYNLEELNKEKEILKAQHNEILEKLKSIDSKIEFHLREEFRNSIEGKYLRNIYSGKLIYVRGLYRDSYIKKNLKIKQSFMEIDFYIKMTVSLNGSIKVISSL